MGIEDAQTQERLLRETNVKLDDAIKFCRLVETSPEHAAKIYKDKSVSMVVNHSNSASRLGPPTTNLSAQNNIKSEDVVLNIKHYINKPKNFSLKKEFLKNEAPNTQDSSNSGTVRPTSYLCKKCNTTHLPAKCPVYGKKCVVCQKMNHFSVGCLKNSNKPMRVNNIYVESDFKIDSVYNRPSLNEKAWFESLLVNGYNLQFKLDSWAEINILPKHILVKSHSTHM